MATALGCRVEQEPQDRAAGLRRLRWSSAGHPAPMLVDADGSVTDLAAPVGPPLGIGWLGPRVDGQAAMPDDSTLANEYVGEETPGGTTPTPDQNGVDEIGRAYGLQEEDNGALRSAAEVLSRRDRWRSELMPPRKPQP